MPIAVPVDVVATGTRSPLGLRSAPTAAAFRAGINRLGEHPFLIDRLGNPMVAAVDAKLDPALSANDRCLALAQHALRELSDTLGNADPRPQIPLYLALPECRPGFAQEDAAEIQARLQHTTGLAFELGPIQVYPRGHAAGALALEAASLHLSRGVDDFCIVGGVDSYFHPDTMHWLDSHRQLAGEDGRSSCVPGEGAGALLLSVRSAHLRLGLRVLASVVSCDTAIERNLIKTADLCLGEGLTAAVASAAKHLGHGERVNDIVCDINGERYRGQEWGFVALKLARFFDDPLSYHSPAGSWGDMGAASIPLFAMLACEAALRGYAKGPRTMLWASSEQGMRGAVILEAGVRAAGGR
jgi:3-oxoacyl-[acyl-carrier-protein] synthase I